MSLSSTHLHRMARYALLFPGQGSQHVGMTEKLVDLPAVREIFSTAERILGYDLLSLCLHGPQSSLDETVHCQPAVVVGSLAAIEELRKTQPNVVARCVACAGFSVGEITALIFSRAISLEAGLRLIKVRAEAMQDACVETKGTMATITGLEERQVLGLCEQAADTCLGEACIANYIFPKGYVVSGALAAIECVKEEARKAGGSVKAIGVSGAFHSPLMSSAVPKIQVALGNTEMSMQPGVLVYSNVTGVPCHTVGEIKSQLAVQLIKPVLWEQSIRNMMKDHAGLRFAEVGPGKQLRSMLKRIDKEAFRECLSAAV